MAENGGLEQQVQALVAAMAQVQKQISDLAGGVAQIASQQTSLETNIGIVSRAVEDQHRHDREFRDIVDRRFDTLVDTNQAIGRHFGSFERAVNASLARTEDDGRTRHEAMLRAVSEEFAEVKKRIDDLHEEYNSKT